MGAQAQSNQSTGGQVYYDPQKSQYYTMNSNMLNPNTGMLSVLGTLSPFSNLQDINRSYLGSSLANQPNPSFATNTSISPYPSTERIFPSLNAGLINNLASQTSSGAGRFTNLLDMANTFPNLTASPTTSPITAPISQVDPRQQARDAERAAREAQRLAMAESRDANRLARTDTIMASRTNNMNNRGNV